MSHRLRLSAVAARAARLAAFGALGAAGGLAMPAAAVDFPITAGQRSTAQQVAQAGVPLSDLAPNAPDSHTVVSGDTLWDISKLFLKSPWRWPELWGMNLDQVRNPHLIYPGQVLVLEKVDGRARLRMGRAVGAPTDTVRLSPRVRSSDFDSAGIPSIPLHLIQPFLNDAVVFSNDDLLRAPRVVATQEGRVLVSRGDLAYVRGDLAGVREFRVYRTPKALVDPVTKEVLGYEAASLGSAEFVREGAELPGNDGRLEIVPSTFSVTDVRQEIGTGDRLAPASARDYANFTPHAPKTDIGGSIVSIYGDGFTAGQNQIVAINRGRQDGVERGHVFGLWRTGAATLDRTTEKPTPIRLPDERNGVAFVFSVFDRVSYALILSVVDPVKAGDRFGPP